MTLLTSTGWAVLFVFGLTVLLHIVLVRVFNLRQVCWNSFEYIWIGIAFLGVLTVIDENNKRFGVNELEKVKIWIERDYQSLQSFLSSDMICFQYHNSGIFSDEEFNRRQARRDTICAWATEMKLIVDSAISNKFSEIQEIPTLGIVNPQEEYEYQRVTSDILEINENCVRRQQLVSATNDKTWENFKYSFGILLLLLAFSLRFTIVSKKVYDSKRK